MRNMLILTGIVVALLISSTNANAQTGFDSFWNECLYDFTRMHNISKDPIAQPGVAVSMHPHAVWGYIRMTENAVSNRVLPFPDNNGDGVSDKPDPGFWVNNGLQVFYPSTTCTGGYNWPELWSPIQKVNERIVPTAADPGLRTVASAKLVVQYRAPAAVDVLPVPYGLAVVVGNAHAASWVEQDTTHVRWACGVSANAGTFAQPQPCPGGQVTVQFTFPDCWDGATGWSQAGSPGASHYTAALTAGAPRGWDATVPQPVTYDLFPSNGAKVGINASHFAYSTFAGCPAEKPYRIAQAVYWRKLVGTNNLPLTSPTGLTFSSGPAYTAHFDYLANYGKSYVVPRVWRCLNNKPVFTTVNCNPIGVPQ